MQGIGMEGVRCFKEALQIPLRPITLLVGENSTGKSTVLAMIRAAWDIAFRGAEPNFNEEPFDLGGYDAIAHFHGGQGKRAQEFKVSAVVGERRTPWSRRPLVDEIRVEATFAERGGQPRLSAWQARQGVLTLRVDWQADQIRVNASRGREKLLSDAVAPAAGVPSDEMLGVRHVIYERHPGKDPAASRDTRDLLALLPFGVGGPPRPIAIAPIRSRPERTYDPRRGLPEPEGSHVPMELATLQATGPGEFEDLAERIATYGADGNLFSRLAVKRLGKKAGDPFQVVVKVDKFPFNLRDVGYGVSQVLPILVDILRADDKQTFLLQQPEVHLHPRAQAALGTLLVDQVVDRQQKFIVETHSDYLVDRVRMSIRDAAPRGLSPDDVAILYFERIGGRSRVHQIRLDGEGNLLDVPPGYRQFFLDEERRLLGL